MFDRKQFEIDKRSNAVAQNKDEGLRKLALDFVVQSDRYHYAYQWTWLGLPIVQLPADILATQELIWDAKPDLIIETGIAWGGSIVMYASLLELLGNGEVIGIDRVLPQHNREAMEQYSFSQRITLLEGSSTDPAIIDVVKAKIKPGMKVMVLLDSNHTHDHVLDELRLYGPMVTPGQWLVVSDTIVEDIPPQTHRPRPWGPGNNPKTAMYEYLRETDRFEEDEYINGKLLMTFTPNGFLRCVK
ncbi:cephalosporin hydroxylase family protein [Ferrovibrio sp.]|uniref:cephalosporin hydroxylase family protein n=1 Tax=Ferrovibrio sp. TaxID=1917215 RepID=UPI000CC7716F|nr:CmcI family methyltransferase [Ferrovibrio sp.]PJI41913.1 MAG: cephalosporin hydroxylase [Ferrovibrio sp.]